MVSSEHPSTSTFCKNWVFREEGFFDKECARSFEEKRSTIFFCSRYNLIPTHIYGVYFIIWWLGKLSTRVFEYFSSLTCDDKTENIRFPIIPEELRSFTIWRGECISRSRRDTTSSVVAFEYGYLSRMCFPIERDKYNNSTKSEKDEWTYNCYDMIKHTLFVSVNSAEWLSSLDKKS